MESGDSLSGPIKLVILLVVVGNLGNSLFFQNQKIKDLKKEINRAKDSISVAIDSIEFSRGLLQKMENQIGATELINQALNDERRILKAKTDSTFASSKRRGREIGEEIKRYKHHRDSIQHVLDSIYHISR